MQVAVAQLNWIVGDVEGNLQRLLAAAAEARAAGADLLVASELALTGYPPRDLLERPAFCRAVAGALATLVAQAPLPLVVGAPVAAAGDPLSGDGPLANAALAIAAGELRAVHHKNLLPSYGVFDEGRYFRAGHQATVVEIAGALVGLSVCEDIWNDAAFWPERRYPRDPIEEAVAAGARLVVNVSASPFRRGGFAHRRAMLAATARRHQVAVVYVNQVGGNDALIFDGRSLALAPSGEVVAEAPAFAEAVPLWAWPPRDQGAAAQPSLAATGGPEPMARPTSAARPRPDADLEGGLDSAAGADDQAVLSALTLGICDYFDKCGIARAVVGLSGGIDSALVAALAVRALGPQRVAGLAMPSRFSSPGSVTDAQQLAANLGIACPVLPLQPILEPLENALTATFAGRPRDEAEENLQARLRGVLLMANANKLGGIVLATGNKSEAAVGYTTLYGDMCGGLSPIGDLFKTEVYRLARLLNQQAGRALIPQATVDKPPSAELRPDQRDDDTLPPYPLLDQILRLHLERDLDVAEIVAAGHEAATVERIVALVRASEHKRRQMAPALRVSVRAFGEGRRLPVAGRTPL